MIKLNEIDVLTENIIKELKRLMFLKKSDFNSKALRMCIKNQMKEFDITLKEIN